MTLVTIKWLEHTTFSFQLETGEVISADPWIAGKGVPNCHGLNKGGLGVTYHW